MVKLKKDHEFHIIVCDSNFCFIIITVFRNSCHVAVSLEIGFTMPL